MRRRGRARPSTCCKTVKQLSRAPLRMVMKMRRTSSSVGKPHVIYVQTAVCAAEADRLYNYAPAAGSTLRLLLLLLLLMPSGPSSLALKLLRMRLRM